MTENEAKVRTSRSPLILGGLAVIGLAAVALLLLLIDPFGWNLLEKASGLRDEAAAAMPPDVGLYAGLDLINFSEEKLTEFSQPFVTALGEPGVEDLGGGLERLDAMLAQELGLTLGDDVMPWLGRSVGLGVTDLVVRPDGTVDQVGWLLVTGTQDRQAADAFLAKLTEQLSQRNGFAPTENEYRGRRIINFRAGESAPLDRLAFTRSAGLVILGSDETAVRAAIDAQEGESLAEDEMFRRLTGTLPEERGLTLYADQARLPDLNRLLAAAAPLAIGPLDLTSLTLPPGAVGVSMIDRGLRLDLAAPADDEPGTEGERRMANRLPAGTLAMLSGDSLDDLWQALKDSLAAGGNLGDFEESMALLSREFGYDPDEKLLPLLNGEWVVALLPASEGLVLELTDRPLGVVLLAGSQDTAALAESVADLSQSLADQRLPLATVDLGEATATIVDLESLVGAPLPLYGLDGDVLFLGTDADNLALTLNGESRSDSGTLSDEAAYRAAGALLPKGYRTSSYVDVARLLDQLNGGDVDLSMRLLEPVQQVIAAGGPTYGGVRQGVAFIVVK